MYECWDCGMVFRGREKGDDIQVFDEEQSRWVYSCPNCKGHDFVEVEMDEEYY